MPSFGGLLIVVAVAFAAPFVLGLFPQVRLPSVVLEIVAGIVIGPSVLGIVHVDQSISVISVIGLAFLLFLAGLEIDFARLRGQVLGLTLLGFLVSFAIAIVVALLLEATGLIETPLLVAIILCATSLGVPRPSVEGRRADLLDVRSAHRRRRDDRRLRRRDPALDLLLGRGRRRLDLAANRKPRPARRRRLPRRQGR